MRSRPSMRRRTERLDQRICSPPIGGSFAPLGADTRAPAHREGARENSDGDRWVKKIFESNVAIHLAPHPIGDTVDDLRPILRRVNVDPEGALAKGKIDDPD